MSKWLAVAAVTALASGCNFGNPSTFTCDQNGPRTCNGLPGGQCEANGLCSVPDATCPSGRRYGDLSGLQSGRCVGQELDAGMGSNPRIDAAIDARPDAPPDAQACFGTDIVRVCFDSAPTAPLTIEEIKDLNTDSDPLCVATKSGGTGYCVLVGTTISIDAKLRARGTKPLVLIASDSITTTSQIDVGSHRNTNPEAGAGADPTACLAGTPPGVGGAGGGAGGSFMGLGGNGGQGGGGVDPAPGGSGGVAGAIAPAVTALRGGCPGQDGLGSKKGIGGHGGGAVFLIAGNSITIGGGINAAGEGGSGGGGSTSGAGGGGSGGMIGFDAPTIMCTSLLLATGGGGAEGSSDTGNSPGAVGNDPVSTAPAPGGGGNQGRGGDGGAGSVDPTAAGIGGLDGDITGSMRGGGGGGGGGAGLIKAPATATLGTNLAPPRTM